MSWAGNVLSFNVSVGANANGLYAMLPSVSSSGGLTGLLYNGSPLTYTTQTIKGVSYAVFPAGAGSYQASYGGDLTPPVISAVSASPTTNSATVTWTTNEPSTSTVSYGTSAATLGSSFGNSVMVTTHSLTVPSLLPGTQYFYRVTSADAANNSATSPNPPAAPLTFTTAGFTASGSITPTASGNGATVTLTGGASPLTATANASGAYSFANLANGNYTVTPSKAGFSFTPASRAITVSGANVTVAAFTAQAVTLSGTITPAAIASGATVTLAGPVAQTATADAAGAFTFSGLPDGTYTVTPSKTNVTFTPANRSVVIAGGVSVSGTSFTAVSTLTVTGNVAPAGLSVGTVMTMTGGATATVDSSGNYTFTSVANGTYTITPSKPAFTFAPASQSVTVNGANVSGINFTAQPITISGTVTPAANGAGTTMNLAGPTSGTMLADAAGAYSFGALGDGTYTVTPVKTGFSFSPASLTVTISGASVSGVDFVATAVPTYTISGALSPTPDGSFATMTVTGDASRTASADVNGNYSFNGLVNGAYTVTPTKTGYVFSPASQTVTVADGNMPAVNFTAQSVNITGTVSPAANGAGTSLTLSGASTGTTTADGSGAFSFRGLPNGTYTVTPAKSGFTFTPSSRTVVISGGVSVGNVDFSIVAFYSVSGTLSPAAAGSGAQVGIGESVATADASGNYTFPNLINGTYTVTPAKPGYVFTPNGQTVTINNANVTGVDFSAAPVTISGTITPAASGTGATITIAGGITATVDATGSFVLNAVPNGTYTLTPVKSGFSFTPASQSVTVSNGVSVSGVSFTAAAVPTGIIIDANKTAGKSTRVQTIATAALSTTAGNELLLAFVQASNVDPGATTVTGVTGGSLTWTLVRRTNTQRGTSEIWRAFAPATLTNATVTATLSQFAAASITVMSFKNVDTTGTNGSGAIGATASASAPTGAPTASLVSTRSGSLVIGGGNDWDGQVARTLGAGQTLVSQFLGTDGDTFWVQRTTNTIVASGTTVTINDTAPANHQYNLTLVEILPALP
jgi:hypothetical protein